MVSPTPFISSDQGLKLWSASKPIWLWDVTHARIVWANRACLKFSGALSMDDLIRLKFQADAPFVRQLALVSKQSPNDADESAKTRELIRFPAKDGDYILDCRCSLLDIDRSQAGVLVELVADKGKVKSTPAPPPTKTYKNGHIKSAKLEADLIVEPGVLPSPKAPPKYTPSATHLGEQAASQTAPAINGVKIEAGLVDEDDLNTLREIARMINGPGGGQALGVNPLSGASGPDKSDGRPVIASRKSQRSSSFDPGAASNVARSTARDAGSNKNTDGPDQQGGRRVNIGGAERNYFLESLPAALAIAMGGRLMRANETFLYAFGFGSESELRQAGGLAALFPQSQNGVLVANELSPTQSQTTRKSGHSARIETLAISHSGRKRHIPIAFRNVSTGREPVQILILHEDALWQGHNQPGGQKMERKEPRPRNDQQHIGQDSIDFLATVSHEVRTPLNSIIGFSELMKDERFGAIDATRFRGYAADIHASAKHALSLINDLLDITKIMAGKPDLDFEAVKIDGVIIEALNGLRAQASKKQIILQSSIEEGLPALFADKRAMKQILLNLVSNAVKFTEPGGQVSVSARPSSSDGVILCVADTGIGMHEDDIDKALEPFAQIKTAHPLDKEGEADPEKGTGLGLPLSRELVKAHQASFDIVSSPGQGTSIEIHFPTDRLVL